MTVRTEPHGAHNVLTRAVRICGGCAHTVCNWRRAGEEPAAGVPWISSQHMVGLGYSTRRTRSARSARASLSPSGCRMYVMYRARRGVRDRAHQQSAARQEGHAGESVEVEEGRCRGAKCSLFSRC